MPTYLAVGDRDHVGRDVGRDVALLRLDERQGRERAAAVGIGELAGALEQARMQVEDVAGIRLASGRTAQRERHLAIGDGLLGEVVVDHEDMPAWMLGIGGVSLGVVVHEELADGGAGHRGDVLHGGGIRGSGRHDDGFVERAVRGERLADGGHRGRLLADGHVDAHHIGVTLVDDRIDGDGRLAGLAVADDELALAAADGRHRVDGDKAGLDGLADGLARHDAGRLELDGAAMGALDRAEAVDGLAERVHHAAEHGAADGDVHDAAGAGAQVALLDRVDLAEEHGTDLRRVEVLGEPVDGLAGGRAGELEQLAGHGGAKPAHMGDAVAHADDKRGFAVVDRGVDGVELAAQRIHDARSVDLHHHSSSPMNVEASLVRMVASWARTLAS